MIHLVYPRDLEKKASPWTIGNNLGNALAKVDDVRTYPWDQKIVASFHAGDILIGHPHPESGMTFERSLHHPWVYTAILCPWNGETNWTARLKEFTVDERFYITGPNHQVFDCTRLNMAIDSRLFPLRKKSFNPPGKRRFLYIGCTLPIKGTSWLCMLAERTGYEFGHLGYGGIVGVAQLGFHDVSDPYVQEWLCKDYDFIISTGITDANPTSLIEGGALGLVARA